MFNSTPCYAMLLGWNLYFLPSTNFIYILVYCFYFIYHASVLKWTKNKNKKIYHGDYFYGPIFFRLFYPNRQPDDNVCIGLGQWIELFILVVKIGSLIDWNLGPRSPIDLIKLFWGLRDALLSRDYTSFFRIVSEELNASNQLLLMWQEAISLSNRNRRKLYLSHFIFAFGPIVWSTAVQCFGIWNTAVRFLLLETNRLKYFLTNPKCLPQRTGYQSIRYQWST